MQANSRSAYTGNREWFRNILGGRDVVLCHTSALECLGQFPGYVNESQIDVYAKVRQPVENLNCYVVDGFDGMDIVNIDGLRCTSLSQTINDMLRDYDVIDEQSLVQALAGFYNRNGGSFSGLKIAPQYARQFGEIKSRAMEFYDCE